MSTHGLSRLRGPGLALELGDEEPPMTCCRPSAHRCAPSCAPRGGSVSLPPTRTVCATPLAKTQYRVDACSFPLYTLAPTDFLTRTPGSVPPKSDGCGWSISHRLLATQAVCCATPCIGRTAWAPTRDLREAAGAIFATGSGGSAAMAWSGEMGMNAPHRVPHAPQGLARERRAQTGEGRLDLARRDTPLRTEMRRWRKTREFSAIASRARFWLAVAPPTPHPSVLYQLPGAGAVPRTFPASALAIGIGIGCEKQGHGWGQRASGHGLLFADCGRWCHASGANAQRALLGPGGAGGAKRVAEDGV
ncbi:hypothetical protein B0H13DRAFT_2499959 [Mycena leptocephala]|nr:hypothetical protein B0H13DRAFT_2499959 [Mycena leptocephala]